MRSLYLATPAAISYAGYDGYAAFEYSALPLDTLAAYGSADVTALIYL